MRSVNRKPGIDVAVVSAHTTVLSRRTHSSNKSSWRKALKRGSAEEIHRLLTENKGLAQSVVDGTGGCLPLHLVARHECIDTAILLL